MTGSSSPGASRLNPQASKLPVLIVGAGPVGLAAAAHLLERGLEPLVLEAGNEAAAAVREWGHVPMFSPWSYNLDRACTALLERHGWAAPDDEAFPTGADLVERYLRPLGRTPELASRVRFGARVTGVARFGAGKVQTDGRDLQPFEISYDDPDGREHRVLAAAVIDASGTWSSPNPAGTTGLAAAGERAHADKIFYGMPDVLGRDRARFAGRRVVVVGSGHSATGTLLDLADLARDAPGTQIVWALRRTEKPSLYGGGAADKLPRRGAIGARLKQLVADGAVELVAPFRITEIQPGPEGAIRILGEIGEGPQSVVGDQIIVATGFRPDLSFLRELRLDLDPALDCPRALGPLIDPNLHSCGTVRPHGFVELAQPDSGLFIAGMKSYGRAPTFLLATGYEQVRSIVAHLAGDDVAARRVELVLPETGVCSGPSLDRAQTPPASSSCCATPAAAPPKPCNSSASCGV